jgi:curved DNA-binding protein CbpA
MTLDYYDILGLTPDATEEEMREKYRELVKINHPDSGTDGSLRFMAIKKAYDVLRDRKKKQMYDRQCRLATTMNVTEAANSLALEFLNNYR